MGGAGVAVGAAIANVAHKNPNIIAAILIWDSQVMRFFIRLKREGETILWL
jgi:hypothetical protein